MHFGRRHEILIAIENLVARVAPKAKARKERYIGDQTRGRVDDLLALTANTFRRKRVARKERSKPLPPPPNQRVEMAEMPILRATQAKCPNCRKGERT